MSGTSIAIASRCIALRFYSTAYRSSRTSFLSLGGPVAHPVRLLFCSHLLSLFCQRHRAMQEAIGWAFCSGFAICWVFCSGFASGTARRQPPHKTSS